MTRRGAAPLAALMLMLLPLPALAGEGLYDSADASLPDWLKAHNYLAAPAAPARPAAVTLRNRGEGALACTVTLAHWYVIRPTPVPPGADLVLPLRYEPVSGTVSWLNDSGVEMAVEGVICGEAPGPEDGPEGGPNHGPDHGTRLDFRALAAAGAVLDCAEGKGCQPAR